MPHVTSHISMPLVRTFFCQPLLLGDGYQRVVFFPSFLTMYLLLLLPLSSWRPVIPLSILLTSFPQCIKTIVDFPKTPFMLSHISSVAVPHLHHRRLHLPVSRLSLYLLSRISAAMVVLCRLHCYPCLPSPLFRIFVTSVVILPRLRFSLCHIFFRHPSSFNSVCLCVPASLSCLYHLHFYHWKISTVAVFI